MGIETGESDSLSYRMDPPFSFLASKRSSYALSEPSHELPLFSFSSVSSESSENGKSEQPKAHPNNKMVRMYFKKKGWFIKGITKLNGNNVKISRSFS